MLNSSLDLKALSQDFQKQRRIRIHDVLRPEIADELAGALERERGWKLLCANLRGAAALGWEGEGFSANELAETRGWLRSKGNSIEGGTSEVMLSILSKAILELG